MSDVPHAINIYTDGSFKKRAGGSGFFIRYPNNIEREIQGKGRMGTTSIRSELRACIDALKYIQKDLEAKQCNYVYIHTDSQHIVDSYYFAILSQWRTTYWTKLDGDDRANKDLWKDFIRESRKVKKRVEIKKVKAHSGIEGNEKADRLAKKSRERAITPDYDNRGGIVRRWLNIPEKKVYQISIKNRFIIFAQRTKPKIKSFNAYIQILRPKKYFGVKTTIRGILGKHSFHVGHIHKVKLKKDEHNNLLLEEIIEDVGRPTDNESLWKMRKEQ